MGQTFQQRKRPSCHWNNNVKQPLLQISYHEFCTFVLRNLRHRSANVFTLQHMNVTIRLQESTIHSSSSKIAISKQEGKVCFRRRALLSPWEDRETWISVYPTTPPDESYQLESGLCRRTIPKQKKEQEQWRWVLVLIFLPIFCFPQHLLFCGIGVNSF